MAVAEKAGLDLRKADKIIEEVKSVVEKYLDNFINHEVA